MFRDLPSVQVPQYEDVMPRKQWKVQNLHIWDTWSLTSMNTSLHGIPKLRAECHSVQPYRSIQNNILNGHIGLIYIYIRCIYLFLHLFI